MTTTIASKMCRKRPEAESATLKAFRRSLAGIDPAPLSLSAQLDREQLIRSLDAEILSLDVIQPWRKDPDAYSSGITRAAYVVMKRPYAPRADRLRSLIARRSRCRPRSPRRERTWQTRRGSTQRSPSNKSTETSVSSKPTFPPRSKKSPIPSLQAEFASTNAAVVAALEDYKTFLQRSSCRDRTAPLPGAPTRAEGACRERDDRASLDRLLAIAEQDLQKNEAAFQATAREIDASKPPMLCSPSLQRDHPPADKLLETTQNELDSLRRFIVERRIVTIPTSEPASVKRDAAVHAIDDLGVDGHARAVREGTAPGLLPHDAPRPTLEASATGGLHARVVLPGDHDRVGPRGVSRSLSPVLYARQFPSDVRKVFGAASNSEGWAHYSEQMMLDEGLSQR